MMKEWEALYDDRIQRYTARVGSAGFENNSWMTSKFSLNNNIRCQPRYICPLKTVRFLIGMTIKANAAMFNYDLITNLANVMLSFLESIKKLDKDVIEIVDAHHKTLTMIVLKKMKGDIGEPGKQLENELKGVCKRYFSRKAKNSAA